MRRLSAFAKDNEVITVVHDVQWVLRSTTGRPL
jgi:hypothetical protein